MKIVFITPFFSERMGYIENCLPKAIASYGHEVHVISANLNVYYNEPFYNKVYEPYLGPGITKIETKQVDGFCLHRLEYKTISNKYILKKLKAKLKEIKPDVVQTFDPVSFINFQIIYAKLFLNFKFYVANHTTASVFPLFIKKRTILYKIAFFFSRTLLGRAQNLFITRSYPVTKDCEEIAIKYYGLPESKSRMVPLGVDTQWFFPASEKNLNDLIKLKQDMGFNKDDIVCIYTGRYTNGKNPLCLANAIEKLIEMNYHYKAIFLGDGEQADLIAEKKGCKVLPFIPYHNLADYYRISNIGVWPTQESTSMLDAAACGLPIIISNKVKAIERIEGNGLMYIENDVDDLISKLLQLKEIAVRKELGNVGMKKMTEQYSWLKIAKDRLIEYNTDLNRK